MSEILRTDYTHQLEEAKKRLDNFFRIVVREDAMRIIGEMESILEDKNKWTALGDKQNELLEILENVPEYMDKYYIEEAGGERSPRELIRSFRYDKNKENIDKAIKVYKKYARKIKSIKEIDRDIDSLFLEKLNSVFSEYKSSTDYMTRLVNRLLKYNVENDSGFKKTDTTRVLILKQFIRQFDWFEGVNIFDVKDIKAVVKEKYDDNYELIDDGIFSYCLGQTPSWHRRKVTEGFLNTFDKIQGIIKHKAPFIPMTPSALELIEKIIVENKLAEKSVLKEAKVLADCFKESHYDVKADWFKEPAEIGVTADLCNVLCRVVKPEILTRKAKKGTAVALTECFKNGRIPVKTNCFKAFDEIEMTPDLCADFCKFLRKETNEDDLRSKAAKNGTAATLAECFAVYDPDIQITSINSIIMYFYGKIYAELNGLYAKQDMPIDVREALAKTFNNSTKKGGDLYDKNSTVLNFHDYSLLRVVDNLSKAKFSNQGKTREYLYVFAIAFDIRKVEDGHPERIVDIEKNLFWDYYADNIVNNLPNVAGLGEDSDIFIDGHGVNYKNFAEVIFLWCLEQEYKTPKERLKAAYNIIEYCKNKGKTEDEFFKDASNSKTVDTKTEVYKDEYLTIKKLPEEKFKEYIKENYPCKSKNSGIVKISAEQRAASEIVQEQEKTVNDLLKTVEEELLYDVTEEDLFDALSADSVLADFFNEYEYLTTHRCKKNCPKNSTSVFPYCKKYFDEFSYEEKDEYDPSKRKTITTKNCGDFYYLYLNGNWKDKSWEGARGLLKHNVHLKIESFKPVEEHFKKSFSKVNELCNDNQESLKLLLNRIKNRLQADTDGKIHFKNVSRSTVVALCFYEFVLINCLKRVSDEPTIIGTFEKVYDSFCNGDVFVIKREEDTKDEREKSFEPIVYEGANKRLESAGYQPIDPKNIFDIYLIYIAYRDNFLQLYSSQDDELIKLYSGYKKVFDALDKNRGDRILDKNNLSKNR